MKRKLLIIATAIILTLIITSCSNNNEPTFFDNVLEAIKAFITPIITVPLAFIEGIIKGIINAFK